MRTVSQLLEAMNVAAQANRKHDYDDLERELLSRFDGGFGGMPADVYDRYLEVDRAWPAVPPPPHSSPGGAPVDGSSAVVGASIEFTVELPEELVSWIAALGDRTGCSRSEVLSECLQSLRGDRRLASALENRLAAKRPR